MLSSHRLFYIDKVVVDTPVVMQRQVSQTQAEIPQIYDIDKVVDMPVVMQRQVPRIQTRLR